jgi:hypothetical protein
MAQRLAVLLAVVLSGGAAAGTKVIKNDTFTGAGGIFAGVSFDEFQGAGVLFEGEPGDYPMKIIAVDILAVPYQQQGTGVGAYLIDLYDEAHTTPPPKPDDAGVWPDFPIGEGRLGSNQGVQLTTSTTLFNRFTLPQPITVAAGKVFVTVTEQYSTSGGGGAALADNTTIALDSAMPPKPNANWFFDGVGEFHVMSHPDGGFYNGLNRNWIIRLVLEVPDTAVTVTSITPNRSVTTASPNVVITGTNFELGAKAFLGTNELTINNLSATSIGATVPAGLNAGVYDVRVRNLGGLEGTLPNGYTVFEPDGGTGTGGGAGGGAGGGGGSTGTEALALTGITPTQTYAQDATSLFLTGAGFKAGAQVLIGGTKLDGAVVESGGVISASLVANQLAPGVFDVSVINLSGERATLPQAFTVLAGSFTAPKGCTCAELDLLPVVGLGLVLLRRRRR